MFYGLCRLDLSILSLRQLFLFSHIYVQLKIIANEIELLKLVFFFPRSWHGENDGLTHIVHTG